jgi:hypothetical protein
LRIGPASLVRRGTVAVLIGDFGGGKIGIGRPDP